MKELIEYIAQSLVDDPSQVQIGQRRIDRKQRIELQVARNDMGRVIGKGGKIANAMRVLLRVAAAREGQQSALHIVEPQ